MKHLPNYCCGNNASQGRALKYVKRYNVTKHNTIWKNQLFLPKSSTRFWKFLLTHLLRLWGGLRVLLAGKIVNAKTT